MEHRARPPAPLLPPQRRGGAHARRPHRSLARPGAGHGRFSGTRRWRMNANEVIESYVCDVARSLPRDKRNDVAFELRALLADELAAKAQAAGRAPDEAMAMDLLQRFGRPAD